MRLLIDDRGRPVGLPLPSSRDGGDTATEVAKPRQVMAVGAATVAASPETLATW